MKRAWRYGIFILLALSMLGSIAPVGAAAPDLQTQLERKRVELEQIESRIKANQRRLADAQRREKATTSQLALLQEQLEDAEAHLAAVSNELTAAEADLQNTVAELDRAEAELDRRTQLMQRRVRALYEEGGVSLLGVLLSSVSFEDFFLRFYLLSEVLRGDVDLFREVGSYRDEVVQRKELAEIERQRVAVLRDEAAAARDDLTQKREATGRMLVAVREDKQAYARALDELERTSREVETQLRSLQRQFEEQIHREGGILLAAPLSAPITSNFGSRFHPILKQWRLHTGTDFGAKQGTPIKAAESGKAFHAGWLGGYGKAVILAHGSGISTLYAHMSQIAVQQGQSVDKGQVVGYVGTTGNSTGPHLHFEVRVDGTPQDPLRYLNKVLK